MINKDEWLRQYTLLFHKLTKLPMTTCRQDAEAELENIDGDTSEDVNESVRESLEAWND